MSSTFNKKNSFRYFSAVLVRRPSTHSNGKKVTITLTMEHNEYTIVQLTYICSDSILHCCFTCISDRLSVSRQPIADFSCLNSHNIMYFKLLLLIFLICRYRIADSGIHCINEAGSGSSLNEFLDDSRFIVCVLCVIVAVPHFHCKSLSCQPQSCSLRVDDVCNLLACVNYLTLILVECHKYFEMF
nr:MAG TPA: hypothetical protein [Caudoviricetes sp.]